MTREIKFRVWDIPNERMIEEPYYFRKSSDSYNLEKSDMEYAETWNDEEDGVWRSCFVMQYIGIKDKNGREIWEGDIVKLEHWSPKVYQVGFNRGAFCFYKTPDDTFYNDCKYLEKCEVIGNIHQDKNLLKQ
jgi:uncharacterized phage protein (TIGR01671 family)